MDNAEHTLLGGSSWEFTPADGAAAFVVEDNEGQAGYAGRDTDPASGTFRVENLAWGRYAVKEAAAPLGYALWNETESFTISATNLHDVRVFPVVNYQSEVPAIPLTGGAASKDAFLVVGAAVIAVSVALAISYARTARTVRTSGTSRPRVRRNNH
jgi:uncharacterized surface anchored protein